LARCVNAQQRYFLENDIQMVSNHHYVDQISVDVRFESKADMCGAKANVR